MSQNLLHSSSLSRFVTASSSFFALFFEAIKILQDESPKAGFQVPFLGTTPRDLQRSVDSSQHFWAWRPLTDDH